MFVGRSRQFGKKNQDVTAARICVTIWPNNGLSV